MRLIVIAAVRARGGGEARRPVHSSAPGISRARRRVNCVYWLEVKDEGGKLAALFLNRGGTPFRLRTPGSPATS